MKHKLFIFLFLIFFSFEAKAELSEDWTKQKCIQFYDEQMAKSKEAEDNYDEAAIKKLEEEGKTEEAYQLGFKPYLPLFEIAFKSPECVDLDERYYEMQKTFCTGYLTASDKFRALMDNMKRPFPYCEEALDRGDDMVFMHFLSYYLRGTGHEKDYATALKFIDEYISEHPDKQDLIFLKAPIYKRGGYGVEKDETKAFEIWQDIYKTYAEQAGSACQLSLYYRDGIGTEKDTEKADQLLEVFKKNNQRGECNHSNFDFLFEKSGLEKELFKYDE